MLGGRKLKVIIWDVQHGNAIYMQTPNGLNFMFDIGSGSYKSGSGFSPLRHMKINRLDFFLISHPHADHMRDLPVIFESDFELRVLSRPKGLPEEFIRKSNRSEDQGLVDLYLELDRKYTSPLSPERNPCLPRNNGGVEVKIFKWEEAGSSNLNNHSLVAVVSFGREKMIIPGDIEKSGWKALLRQEEFLKAIKNTSIFIASHHGRESGYCGELFNYFTPDIVIISDGRFCDTSATDRYDRHAKGFRVYKRDTNESKIRKVLTTRNDGAIWIGIEPEGKMITVARF